MPVPCFTHETVLDDALNAQSSSVVAKKISEKYRQLSFSIDQKMIAARYFLGCLKEADFFVFYEMLASSDPIKARGYTITYGMPDVYCDFSLHAKAKPAYQFLLNLLVDGVVSNLVGITDILGKVIAELYGFSTQKDADHLYKVRDYMTKNHSTSPISTYLKENYPINQVKEVKKNSFPDENPDTNVAPFHWLTTLKKIRNELEHQNICDIGVMRADQPLGGYHPTDQVILCLSARFFQSGATDDERDVLKFAASVEGKMEGLVDDIYRLLAQEVKDHGVPL